MNVDASLYTTAIGVSLKVAAAHFAKERKVAPQRNSAPPANDEKILLTILFRAKKAAILSRLFHNQ